jgi:hypothetical protein
VTVRIDCPPPGWIPGSTRCAVIHVTRTCFAAWACRNEAQRSHLGEVVIQKQSLVAKRASVAGVIQMFDSSASRRSLPYGRLTGIDRRTRFCFAVLSVASELSSVKTNSSQLNGAGTQAGGYLARGRPRAFLEMLTKATSKERTSYL